MSAIDLDLRPVVVGHVRVKMDPVTGEPVLLFPEGVLVLNSTAHEIVGLCDGIMTGREIIAALSVQYEIDEATLRIDVEECLVDLLKRNLVEFIS